MPHAEDIVVLRQKLIELQTSGLLPDQEGAAMYQATLLQFMNEAERRRAEHLSAAERCRMQAVAEENQAKAYSAMSSIVFDIINGYLNKAQQMVEEARERTETEE